MVHRRNIYKGTYLQRGNGIGSVLMGIIRTLVPFIRSGAKAAIKAPLVKAGLNSAKKAAIGATVDAIKDITKGKSPVKRAGDNFKKAQKNLNKISQNRTSKQTRPKRKREQPPKTTPPLL